MKTPFAFFRRRGATVPSSAPGATQKALSLLSPQHVQSRGLPAAAICGFMVGDDDTETNFRPNRVFIDFMHNVIASAGPDDLTVQSAARTQDNGFVYLIDLRTPEGPQGRVPLEDVVGAFKVENGRIVAGSYRPNEKHKVFTKNGLVRLPPSLLNALITALMKCEVTP